MARTTQPLETTRRKPQQARAEETVAAILEAAAQILEAGGLAAFTTNAVAERAGVSIGTLYQYFADKNAVLCALAEREMNAVFLRVAEALRGDVGLAADGRVRAMIRAIVGAFRGRQRARKAVLQAILSQGQGGEMMAPIAAFITRAGESVGRAPAPVFAALSPEQIFVVSRALMGAIRSAVLEEQAFFKSRSFEDELVRLVLAYLGAVTDGP
ncbi:MAG: TetR/AcrR family transcriptional regulator [Proteobacteria bacterium]|nr:TetR/AcrR family transcriptional regulator [Pseudomonadota bacterium]